MGYASVFTARRVVHRCINGGCMTELLQMTATRLHDPLTWLGFATFIACCAAGWYCGDIAHAVSQKFKGE